MINYLDALNTENNFLLDQIANGLRCKISDINIRSDDWFAFPGLSKTCTISKNNDAYDCYFDDDFRLKNIINARSMELVWQQQTA